MKNQLLKIIIGGAAATVLTAGANAGAILGVSGATENSMGEYGSGYAVDEMFSQTGLSANYASGVTDFATFVSSGVTHSGGDGNSWLSSYGTYSGYLVFDLGAAYSIENFVMWNGASGITASANSFSLSTSMTADFATATAVGSFMGQQSNYAATVYDMLDSTGRYVRMDIASNFGNGCCTAIGDIAFDVNAAGGPAPVPEPHALALLGLGLAGFVANRKKKTS